MTSKSKWSLTGFSLFLVVYIGWRHFFDLFQWRLELSLEPIVIQRRNYQEYIEVSTITSQWNRCHHLNVFKIFIALKIYFRSWKLNQTAGYEKPARMIHFRYFYQLVKIKNISRNYASRGNM